MKPQTIRYYFKEGFSYLFGNKLMFFVSTAIIAASLTILGVFLIVIVNIDENLKTLDERPQIQVYCLYDLSEEEVGALEDEIRKADIREFVRISKDEAYLKAQELLGEDATMLEGFGNEFLPESFLIKLNDSSMTESFVEWVQTFDGVDQVFYPKTTIDFITKVSSWAKIFGMLLVSIPMLFSVFIISNTIRLAVIERRNEISIMRYIGATEQLIKWPFIIEGVIIGMLAAVISFLITSYGYRMLERSFNVELSGATGNLFRLIQVGDVAGLLLLIYMIIGIGVGAIGSIQSIRKYLHL